MRRDKIPMHKKRRKSGILGTGEWVDCPKTGKQESVIEACGSCKHLFMFCGDYLKCSYNKDKYEETLK